MACSRGVVAYYSDRKLGVSEMVCTAASTIHLFTGNNIGAKGDLASRSLHIRLDVDRVDPENRPFKHPDPVGWTENHRAEILAAVYTILLGNPQLKAPRDAGGQGRASRCGGDWLALRSSTPPSWPGTNSTSEKLFITQEEDDEESASLADVLEVLLEEMAGAVHGERRGRDDQQPVPQRRREHAARLFAAGRATAPRVLGKDGHPAAEAASR